MEINKQEWLTKWDGYDFLGEAVCLAWIDGKDISVQFDKIVNGKQHIYHIKFDPESFATEKEADAAIVDIYNHFKNLLTV